MLGRRTAQHNSTDIRDCSQIVLHSFHRSTRTNFPLGRLVLSLYHKPRMISSHRYPKRRCSREHHPPGFRILPPPFLNEVTIPSRHHGESTGVSTRSNTVGSLPLVALRPSMDTAIPPGKSRSHKIQMVALPTNTAQISFLDSKTE